jgi:putative ABC transport system permease protein
VLNDLSCAVRALRRSPVFAASAILALALGIGANTAVFSVVYAVLLQPLPYFEPDRLVRLYETNPADGVERGAVSVGTFVDWRTRSRMLQGVAAYTTPLGGETLWTIGDRVHVVRVSAVSPALFSILHVNPILGAGLRSEHETPPSGALGQFVISYGLWQSAFGGAPDIVGRRIMVEGRLPREIAGVMPKGFAFPERAEAWTSLSMTSVAPSRRRSVTVQALARLASGAAIDDARRELRGISRQLETEQPASNAGWTADVTALGGSDAGSARFALQALMAAVAGVLLIGCANVANLLLARASARRREVAVRIALGAGAVRVVRLWLLEAALVSGAGVVAGLLLGNWLASVLVRLAPADVPGISRVGMSWSVFAFAAALGLLTATVTGLSPALQAIRSDVSGVRPDLRSATERGPALRRWLIGGEVAIVVLLLTSAMLLVRTFVNLRGVDLGFDTDHVVEVEARWPIGTLFGTGGRGGQWPRVQRAVDGLLESVAAIPGVEAAGLVTEPPLTGLDTAGVGWRADAAGAHDMNPPSDPRDVMKADIAIVSPGYFPALGVPVLRGRNFTPADRFSDAQLIDPAAPRSGVLIVNAALASRYFPGEDPVGHSLVIPGLESFGAVRTIVGVVGDVRAHAVSEGAQPMAFIPHAENPDVIRPSLLVRSGLPFASIAESLRNRIAEYDPTLLVLRVRPMDDVVSGALSRPRFNLVLLSSFALVALVLAAVGIYGVLASLVAQRTREIGIRMAHGARAGDVVRLMIREGMMPVLAGGFLGLVVSLAATRALRALLFGVTPLDPISLAGAPLLLATVALAACYLPARRASRVDPLVALRDE